MGTVGRPAKSHKPVSVRMATPIFEELENFCAETGLKKTTVIEKAVMQYIRDYYKKQEIIRKAERDAD